MAHRKHTTVLQIHSMCAYQFFYNTLILVRVGRHDVSCYKYLFKNKFSYSMFTSIFKGFHFLGQGTSGHPRPTALYNLLVTVSGLLSGERTEVTVHKDDRSYVLPPPSHQFNQEPLSFPIRQPPYLFYSTRSCDLLHSLWSKR